jgi:hypothetical protein
VTELAAGMDFRHPDLRREVFLRFYEFHLRYRSHPGGVYYALPLVADALGWDPEERAWAAFLNGNTQNPVTTLLLMAAGSRPRDAAAVIDYWHTRYGDLAWDTDRRYHKARLDLAVLGYLELTGGAQVDYWRRAAERGWAGCWAAARAVPTMGRLSAWSYLEYVKLLLSPAGVGDVPDSDTLMLSDREGSRSHRNGLALVDGRDEWMWWKDNPTFGGRYTPAMLEELEAAGSSLLAEARARTPGHPDVGYLTLESALCTYKSWHRPNRRYPGVYNDLMYERIRHGEARHGDRFGALWAARERALPPALRLEDNPHDPGAVPAKQNWYLETGEVIVMDLDWPCFANGFAAKVAAGAFGTRPR